MTLPPTLARARDALIDATSRSPARTWLAKLACVDLANEPTPGDLRASLAAHERYVPAHRTTPAIEAARARLRAALEAS